MRECGQLLSDSNWPVTISPLLKGTCSQGLGSRSVAPTVCGDPTLCLTVLLCTALGAILGSVVKAE